VIAVSNEVIATESAKFGLAWIFLCIALALHVADEALTDFLSEYNPTAREIRRRFPFLPLPVFTFRVWLTGLCAAILLAFCMSPLAFSGSRLAIVLAYPFSIIMFANGLGHIGASLYRRRWVSGVYSSPLLLAASAYLLVRAHKLIQTN
jgi:hypothetical protein